MGSSAAFRSPSVDAAGHAAAKRAFFRIMDAWGVSDGQARVLLGSPSRSTFYTYKRGAGGDLSHDALERVSYVLGIYKDLQLLFPNPAQADAWMGRPNRDFGGRSALEHALGGRVVDLADVRRYLDAVRGQGA
jgi:hypothetical protein